MIGSQGNHRFVMRLFADARSDQVKHNLCEDGAKRNPER